MVGPERFCFLNETHSITDQGWDGLTLEKLWRYNLHYFDDLNAQDANVRTEWHRALLLRWVRENPPALGTGWEPYPTSLRIVNWIKWALSGNALPQECAQSLAVQTRWLSRRLEIHLLGNHLFSNAKAMVFAGLFFEGPEAEAWIEKGLRILEREVPEQILPDGGQFERSTMYHALALEDMLDLVNMTAAFSDAVPSRWQSRVAGWFEQIGPMRDWLTAMCHPDGEISFFNDAAIGIAPPPSELERYAQAIGFEPRPYRNVEVMHLRDSGYIRLERNEMVALLDVAPVGPDYLTGHAHADTLSFELSLYGKRVFVNSGTSCYGESAERMRQRGTAAHTTLMLNGHNSSMVWGGFRVAHRARVLGPKIWQKKDAVCIEAGHDGYQQLPGRPIHWRCWRAGKGYLQVEDRVEGSGEHLVEIFFYLHPNMRPLRVDDGAIAIQERTGTRIFRMHMESPGNLHLEKSIWHPGFGLSVPSFRIVFRKRQQLPTNFMFKVEY